MASTANSRLRAALKTMALLEAGKGIAALLGLLGVLSLLHHDLHALALEFIGHVGLSPTQHYPQLLLQAADKFNMTPVHTLVWMGGLYVTVRFAEAWGLWWDRAWGEWLGVISSGAYIPFEVHHVWLHRHWQGAVVLLLNVVLVCVLLIRLRQRQRQKTTGSGTESVLQSS